MKFSMIFTAVDKASRTMRKIMSAEKKLAATARSNASKAARATGQTERALSRTERTLASLSRVGRRAFDGVVTGARKAGQAVGALHRKTLALARGGFGRIADGAGRAKNGVIAGAAMMSIAYGSAAVAAGALVGTASEFERFETILTTTEGSAVKAAEAMKWVQDFAVSTPYELDQVTEAFVQLRAYGLDPTGGMMRTLGDTSAAMGKDLMQAVEAIADAVTGENERLKEFGIKASVNAGKITYAYTNAAGQQMEAVVKAGDRIAIQQTLMNIMNEKYAGSMDRLSKTWDGMMSNLMDQWTKFQMMIMEAGLFDWMKGKLEGVLETINQMEADGTLQEWATSISNDIQAALKGIWEFGKGALEVIRELSKYLSAAADYVGGWKNLAAVLGAMAFGPTLVATAAGLVQIARGLAMLGTALMANPIMLAIAAIAFGAYLIYRNWDKIGPYFEKIFAAIKNTISTTWAWMKKIFAWTPAGLITNNWDQIVAAIKNPMETARAALDTVWEAIKSAFKWSPVGLLVASWAGVASALSQPVASGKTAIEIAWEGIKAVFGWTPLGVIAENWSGIGTALSAPLDAGRGLVSLAWDRVKSIFSGQWLPDIDTSTLSAGMETITGIVDRAWGVLEGIFDSIVAGATKLGEAVGTAITAAMEGAQAALDALGGSKGVDRIFDQLGAQAERGLRDDFVQGQALTEALAAGEIGLDSYRNSLRAAEAEGGKFAATARDMLTVSRQLENFKMPEPPAPSLPPMTEIDAALNKLTAIETAAAQVPDTVAQAMSKIDGILAATDFSERGVALMRTLADGIRAGIHHVVDATAEATQAIRDHLPSSPAKVGPLSDIHRLKFGETVAASIRAAPMVAAMETAARATMAAASPGGYELASATSTVTSAAARSVLPTAQEARAARSHGPGREQRDRPSITVHFGDTHINGGAPDAQRDLRKAAQNERQKFAQMMERYQADEDRRRF